MNFIAELIKFLGSPTRGKWPTLITLFLLGLVLLIGYERCTATFRLSRLQKESDLLARLQEIQTQGTNAMTPELSQLKAVLLTNATRIIGEKPLSLEIVPSKLTFSFDSLRKFLAGAFLVWGFGFYSLIKLKNNYSKKNFFADFVLGVISGFAGLFTPTIWWPWFHLFVFPFLLLIGIVVVVAPIAIFATNFQAARKKASSNACINNLRQINVAINQWALENSKQVGSTPSEEDLLQYFSGSTFPKCPNGGSYKINPLGVNPTCTEKGHHLPHE